MLLRNFVCKKYVGDIEETVEEKERLCNEMETVRDFIYVYIRVSAVGGCEFAVTAR